MKKKSKSIKDVEIVGISPSFPMKTKNFSKTKLKKTCILPSSHPYIGELLQLSCKSKVINKYTISTPMCCSHEGQVLTGIESIVTGKVYLEIEYVNNTDNNAVHTETFEFLYSTYIILDSSFPIDFDFSVNSYIEDIEINMLTEESLTVSIMILNSVIRKS